MRMRVKLTLKKNTFENIVQAMGFAEDVKFWCYDRYVLVQAYKKNIMEEVLADIRLSPETSGGVLCYYSLESHCLYMGIKTELLLERLKGVEGYVGPFITIEADARTRKANFRVHAHLDGELGDDQHSFTLEMLYVRRDQYYGPSEALGPLNLSEKPSDKKFRDFSRDCADLLLKGVDSVYLGIPDSSGFELYTYEEDSDIKKDLVRLEVGIPRYNGFVCHCFSLRYLNYFTKVAAVTSEVAIGLTSDYPIFLVSYNLTKTDFINFFLYSHRGYHVEDLSNDAGIVDDLGHLGISDPNDSSIGMEGSVPINESRNPLVSIPRNHGVHEGNSENDGLLVLMDRD